jgi:hypothetical protein
MTATQALGGLVLAVSLAASPAAVRSGGAPVFAWGPTSARVIAQIVEQQSVGTTITNPTACPWSEDDSWYNGSYGVLNAGTTSFTDCMIADNTLNGIPLTHLIGLHVIGLQLIADTPNLLVQISYQPQDVTFTFTPQLISGRYVYQGCILGPQPDSDLLQIIPSSNGGYGFQESITVLTTNSTGHKWQKTQANIWLEGDIPGDEAVTQCRARLSAAGTGYKQNGALWQSAL